jgi:DNA-binding MarR family transcriptional regulator
VPARAPVAKKNVTTRIATRSRATARAPENATAPAATMVPSALAVQSWLSVVRAYNLCTSVLSQRLAALDLHLAEHEVLVNLLRLPGLTQQQLAERCFVAKSGISMLITRMERAGWVERVASEADARARLLHLTSKGLALAERGHAIQSDVVNAMTQHFSERELAFVDESMQQVSSVLESLKR